MQLFLGYLLKTIVAADGRCRVLLLRPNQPIRCDLLKIAASSLWLSIIVIRQTVLICDFVHRFCIIRSILAVISNELKITTYVKCFSKAVWRYGDCKRVSWGKKRYRNLHKCIVIVSPFSPFRFCLFYFWVSKSCSNVTSGALTCEY